MKTTTLFIFCVLLLASRVCSEESAGSAPEKYPEGIPVKVSLESSWKNTPLLLEGLELLSKEAGESAYKDFIGTYRVDESATAQDQYNALVERLSKAVPEYKRPLVELSLASRTYSPAVAFQAELQPATQPVAPFAVVGRRLIVSSPEDLTPKSIKSVDPKKQPSVVPAIVDEVDHVIKASSTPDNAHEVYVYGVPGTEAFAKFHKAAMALTEKDESVTYVVRYSWDTNGNGVTGALAGEQNTPLQGYGVEFSLKSVEYKTIDERRSDNSNNNNAKTKEPANKEDKKNGDDDEWEPIEKSDHFDQMETAALESIGVNAALHVMSSPANERLRTLRRLTGDFPAYAANLARDLRHSSDAEKIRHELYENSRRWGNDGSEDDNLLMINNAPVGAGEKDWFSIARRVETEMGKAAALHDTYGVVSKAHAVTMVSTPLPRAEELASELHYNITSPHIAFINDLEHDTAVYGKYPRNLDSFLHPSRPNGFRYVARNLVNVIFVFDPADVDYIEFLGYFYDGIRGEVPYRFGLLMRTPADPEADSDALATCSEGGDCTAKAAKRTGEAEPNIARLIAKVFYYIRENHGPRIALIYFNILNRYTRESEPVQLWMVRAAYMSVRKMNGNRMAVWDTFVEGPGSRYHSAYNAELAAINAFLDEKGVDHTPVTFANGVLIDELMYSRRLIWYINSHVIPDVVDLIRRDVLTDDTKDLYARILEASGALPRISRFANTKPRYAEPLLLTSNAPVAAESGLNALDTTLLAGRYFHSKNPTAPKKLSVVACIDPAEEAELNLAQRLLHSLQDDARLALFSRTGAGSSSSGLWRALRAAASIGQERCSADIGEYLISKFAGRSAESVTDSDIVAALEADVSFDVAEAVEKLLKKWEGSKDIDAELGSEAAFCAAVAPATADSPAVLLNGRVLELAKNDVAEFREDDFIILQRTELAAAERTFRFVGAAPLGFGRPLRDTVGDAEYRSFLQVKVAAQAAHDNSEWRKRSRPGYLYNSFIASKDFTAALVDIDFIVDPLSRTAQRYAPILERLAETLPVRVRVYFTPQTKYEKLPLKTFYRYVLEPKISFDAATGALLPGNARGLVARGLPATRLITLGMEVPHKWIVMASAAVHDLDNIRLDAAEKNGDASVDAVFRLEHILVEGNCYEEGSTESPRALELELTPRAAPAGLRSDTLVMSNLGYFQLKAAPGLWDLHVHKGGRSALLYSIRKDGGSGGIGVVVNSMSGADVKIYAKKNPGHENESLLDENVKDGESNVTDDTINVFSIASGHLYERFIKIMMLSVLRGTKSPVKFWFIKNYLSPQFKETIGDLSKHYGFEYELITYKWPHWLFAQTEKQRITWGYKILFLDVIFPVSLKKVIYVDADQVIRSDLHELMEIPLDGAPVAMTPFCRGNSKREETAGYRFWDQGFWKEHLEGKPYHISALFVVDLQKFRRMGAGDTYRSYYDNLAHDPNSLSNLDQDLPNYLQFRVPMKSLPQEWLWCQTWCNDESKPKAKTIDLCNNPMTKIPKLDSARLIIPEWNDLDSDIHNTEMEILKNKTK